MTTDAASAEQANDDKKARATVIILVLAQGLCGAMLPLNTVVATLAGAQLLENDAFATLPLTVILFGTMCSTVPAAFLCFHIGRRASFTIGALVGAVGGVVAALSIMNGLFPGLLVGAFLTGASQAFVQQYRYAVADQASPSFRPIAISWVMLGGILAGIVGSQAVIYTTDLLPSSLYAGCYFAQAALCLMGIPILATLRLPRAKERKNKEKSDRSLIDALKDFPLLVAIVCGACAYGTMSLIMTAAPLAMKSFDHTDAQSALGIQWHVLAMYGPSFFTGSLINRFGAQTIVAIGFVFLGLSAIIGYLDTTVFDFWTSLIFLGIGWNFGYIGATTLVTSLYRPEDGGRVQALNELLVYTCVVIASLSSGVFLELVGWHALLVASAFPILLSLGLLFALQLRPMK